MYDALPTLNSIDPLSAVDAAGFAPMMSTLSFVVNLAALLGLSPSKRGDGVEKVVRSPYGIAYISFVAGCIHYYAFLKVLGMSYEQFAQSLADTPMLCLYLACFLSMMVLIKVVVAEKNRRLATFLAIFFAFVSGTASSFLWCLHTAEAAHGANSDVPAWMGLLSLVGVLAIAPGLLGFIFKRVLSSIGQPDDDSTSFSFQDASNSVFASLTSILICALCLFIATVHASAIVNLPGLIEIKSAQHGESSFMVSKFNITLLAVEERRFTDGVPGTRFEVENSAERKQVSYKGYNSDGNLWCIASTAYGSIEKRREVCAEYGKDVIVGLFDDGITVRSTTLRSGQDGDYWEECLYDSGDGGLFTRERWEIDIASHSIVRHVDYQTTSNAKSHAIAGKWYKGYEHDPYYCELRSYDDSWNWIETAWFDKEGELVIVSAMSDGEWKNTSTSNWSDFHYNYPRQDNTAGNKEQPRHF